MKKFILALVSLFATSFGYSEESQQLNFPKDFLWGTATAEYQNSGQANCPNTNWAAWEEGYADNGKPHIAGAQRSGSSADHWNRFKEDISLMQKLGVNSYRFSIDWSKIEPEEGKFDMDAINHYKAEIDALVKAEITPMVTLHHFTHPLWFELKGGFEKEENIAYFTRFCTFVFSQFKDKVSLWCTFNEPSLYAFTGYAIGRHPPGKTDWNEAGIVLKNLLKAHIEVYKALKAIDPQPKIGIVHNILKLEPYHSWQPFEALASKYVSRMMHGVFMDFFKTGIFDCYVPLKANVHYEDKEAVNCLDFIGLNYYSTPLIRMQYWALLTFDLEQVMQSTCYPDQIMSDAQFRLYPEGIYDAIKEISALKLPIYITENGIADAKDDRRPIFIKKYLEYVSKAIEEGYDVRGYFYWTLMDNFEWADGFDIEKYGLYAVDFKTKERKLREGAKAYIDIIEQWKKFSLEGFDKAANPR